MIALLLTVGLVCNGPFWSSSTKPQQLKFMAFHGEFEYASLRGSTFAAI